MAIIEHNYFSMDCLNKKAINTISAINSLFKGLKSGNSKTVPLAKVDGKELTFKDFENLFWTYAKWRQDNELKGVSYSFVESSVKTDAFLIGGENTNVETITICVADNISEDVFNLVDVPNEFKKRDGKAEKAKTAENTAKKEEEKKVVENAKKVISEVSGDEHYTDNIKEAVDKFNEQVEADNLEILNNTINSYADMIGKLFGDSSNKKALQEMLFNFATTILS